MSVIGVMGEVLLAANEPGYRLFRAGGIEVQADRSGRAYIARCERWPDAGPRLDGDVPALLAELSAKLRALADEADALANGGGVP